VYAWIKEGAATAGAPPARGRAAPQIAIGILALAALALAGGSGASAQQAPLVVPSAGGSSYWLLSWDDRTWCGYGDAAAFHAALEKPAESSQATAIVTVTYASDSVSKVTYHREPEGGDWELADTYAPSGDSVSLRREISMADFDGLAIVQETSIRGGKADPLRTVGFQTLDGGKPSVDVSKVDVPKAPIFAPLAGAPFIAVAGEMRSKQVAKSCRTF
jgi:hypothetical protein